MNAWLPETREPSPLPLPLLPKAGGWQSGFVIHLAGRGEKQSQEQLEGGGHSPGPTAPAELAQSRCDPAGRAQDQDAGGPDFVTRSSNTPSAWPCFSASPPCPPALLGTRCVWWRPFLMPSTRRLCITWCIIHLGTYLFAYLKHAVAGLILLFIFTIILARYRWCLFFFHIASAIVKCSKAAGHV